MARPYGFNDAFKGSLKDDSTLYQGIPFQKWLSDRGLTADEIACNHDLQAARIFPICTSVDELGIVMRWMQTSRS